MTSFVTNLPLAFDLELWAITWLPIIFMGMIVSVLLAMLRFMPSFKMKPQEIKPQSSESIGWGDVAGADEAKDELREVVEFLRDPKRFKQLGARVPKGILLHGPPGTGKTLLAKAVANESNARFYAQSASSFVEMFAGLGAARIRRLFKEARNHAPAIVFIDELDAVGSKRGNDISGEKDQTLNQLLVELDGFGGREGLVVIGASNLLEKLDSALLRPGRFDRQIFVTPPDLEGRKRILAVHTRGKPLEDGIDLDLVARQTAGLTGADLANICNEAAIFAGRDRRDVITTHDFHGAREARRGLPRGRSRALCRAAALGREGSPRLDRPAWQGARLHAQPPRGGPLPQDARGADGPARDAARRPRHRARDLRSGHHRRVRRPAPCPRDQPLDGHPVRHGNRPDVAPARRAGLRDVRRHPPLDRRGAAVHRRRGSPPRARADRRAPPAARRAGQPPAGSGGARARGHRPHRRRARVGRSGSGADAAAERRRRRRRLTVQGS